MLEKKLPVMEIVTHRFPLARIQEGLELAARPTERIAEDPDNTPMRAASTKKTEPGLEEILAPTNIGAVENDGGSAVWERRSADRADRMCRRWPPMKFFCVCDWR